MTVNSVKAHVICCDIKFVYFCRLVLERHTMAVPSSGGKTGALWTWRAWAQSMSPNFWGSFCACWLYAKWFQLVIVTNMNRLMTWMQVVVPRVALFITQYLTGSVPHMNGKFCKILICRFFWKFYVGDAFLPELFWHVIFNLRYGLRFELLEVEHIKFKDHDLRDNVAQLCVLQVLLYSE